MPRWIHSITLRLSIAFALLATLVFAALGIYFSRAADAHMAELDAHELLSKLALIGHVAGQAPNAEAFAARLGDTLIGEHGVLVTVNGENGAIFKWPISADAEQPSITNVALGRLPVRLKIAGTEYRALAADMETSWGESAHVVVARDIGHHTGFLAQLLHDFQLAIVVAAALTAFIGVLLVRHGMRPLRDIARTAGQISAGKLAARIPQGTVPPELAELVQAFNAMLGRLEESFTRLSDFSADLAHELRTPIHSLRMQAEVSLSKARDVHEYRELLAANLEAYDRLSRIIADMLFLAKADHGLLMPQREAVALMPLCERLLEYYGLLAEHIDLRLDGENISVNGDRLMLERAIGNVLINAIQHTAAGGVTSVRLEQIGELAQIVVTNTGHPIPADALPRVFDRFVRADASSEGNGLGLAIARSIVLAHQGEIVATATKETTVFCLRFPIGLGMASALAKERKQAC